MGEGWDGCYLEYAEYAVEYMASCVAEELCVGGLIGWQRGKEEEAWMCELGDKGDV